MKKCLKCNAEFRIQENLMGYSPVSLYQLNYCPKCLAVAVNIQHSNEIFEFNKNLKMQENEKRKKSKTPIWKKAWWKKGSKS